MLIWLFCVQVWAGTPVEILFPSLPSSQVEWKGQAVKNGKGKLTILEGKKKIGQFVGTFENGKPIEGVLTYYKKWSYTGPLAELEASVFGRSGQGYLEMADEHGRMGASVYNGMFQRDLFEGKGELVANNLVYVGEFSRGKPHGKGKLSRIQRTDEVQNADERIAESMGLYDNWRSREQKILQEGIWDQGKFLGPSKD